MTVWYRGQYLIIMYEFGSYKNVLYTYRQIYRSQSRLQQQSWCLGQRTTKGQQHSATQVPTNDVNKIAVGLYQLQRNSNCNALSRNEKKQTPAETSDAWKTKSNADEYYSIILSLPTVSIGIISNMQCASSVFHSTNNVTCNVHTVYFICTNNVFYIYLCIYLHICVFYMYLFTYLCILYVLMYVFTYLCSFANPKEQQD